MLILYSLWILILRCMFMMASCSWLRAYTPDRWSYFPSLRLLVDLPLVFWEIFRWGVSFIENIFRASSEYWLINFPQSMLLLLSITFSIIYFRSTVQHINSLIIVAFFRVSFYFWIFFYSTFHHWPLISYFITYQLQC